MQIVPPPLARIFLANLRGGGRPLSGSRAPTARQFQIQIRRGELLQREYIEEVATPRAASDVVQWNVQ